MKCSDRVSEIKEKHPDLFPDKKDLVYNIYPELVDIFDNVRAQECSKPVLKFLKKITKKKTQKSIKDIIAKCDKHFYDRASNPSPSEEDKVAGQKCVSDLKAKYKL
jgi:hypothetical protein